MVGERERLSTGPGGGGGGGNGAGWGGGTHRGTQDGELRSTSHVAKRFICTGRAAGPGGAGPGGGCPAAWGGGTGPGPPVRSAAAAITAAAATAAAAAAAHPVPPPCVADWLAPTGSLETGPPFLRSSLVGPTQPRPSRC